MFITPWNFFILKSFKKNLVRSSPAVRGLHLLMRGLGGILVGYTLRYLAQAGETGRQATGGILFSHLPPRIHKHHQRYPDRLGVLSHWATTVVLSREVTTTVVLSREVTATL